MEQALNRRRSEGTLRTLMTVDELQTHESLSLIDFSSNDYLGLAQCSRQQERVEAAYQTASASSLTPLGATGSRLLSGDSVYCRKLEEWLARLHNRPAALVCNSGYDANLCITSCLPVDVVLMDELCHNSIVMGVRWNSRQENTIVVTFRHCDVKDLEQKLQTLAGGKVVLVVVESVYSMDGDVAPLQDIMDVSSTFGAQVVVDEAHGLGIFGRTNRRDLNLDDIGLSDENSMVDGGTGVLAALNLESHPSLLCSVHTFGKAAGCHGAVLCCSSQLLRDYLLNYARPFIYSTALPLHSLVTIQCSYESMIGNDGEERRRRVFELVRIFRHMVESILKVALPSNSNIALCPSDSPIQALLVPGNEDCIEFCRMMQRSHGILLYPIRAPTVPRGQERVRIILHAHNTLDQVTNLVECMSKTLRQMRQTNLFSRL